MLAPDQVELSAELLRFSKMLFVEPIPRNELGNEDHEQYVYREVISM